MKVRALVASAMVITSVNAGLIKKVRGWFVRRGSMSKAESLQRLLPNGPSPFQDPKATNKKLGDNSGGDDKDPVCDPIISALSFFHGKAVEFSSKIPSLRPIPYKLRKKRRREAMESDEDNPEMELIKRNLINLERKYREFWTLFIEECWTKFVRVLSPEEMIERGYFLRRRLPSTFDTTVFYWLY
ncbi:hypothetical protein BASA50_010692 [Batrachochytrium salamandrivorans]|uniref:Uncharacterized protein n=1 Tax=Batrachochytrium salamandrivorans TaxID=1357716 RepID=A0ABQ8EXU7_9FUNG|nr:hypothetical protein BASA62_005583 [Batrachochytrium salamandrivorans]KAH6582585.1 hypothetical protein BASA61_008485 [Batrachochytrium salamandrivorans]KAH6588564.1 hypothetical protein BASA50_010692 [Batrachochytrium salamandrivorans]KAH9245502.1 hypothetical protein BASA81_017011 [Batrachochytrium salamandrivorans]KAH9268912.1 hypothetical protein BASA83_009045 [Batrachochytrium salamandrivorans]